MKRVKAGALATLAGLYGCGLAQFGHDPAPKGCWKSTVVSSRFDGSSRTISLALANGSAYRSDPTTIDYGSPAHLGPFKKGETVIICPASGAFRIRNDIVGSLEETFHVSKQN